MQTMKVLLVGATGLIGSELLDLFCTDENVTEIKTLTRRPIIKTNSKVKQSIINFEYLDNDKVFEGVDTVCCCLGTTIADAGSREVFKEVDYGIVIKIAKLARNKGVSNFLYVSSLGANESSMAFYLKIKGEVEVTLRELSFNRLVILRPSLLLGKRKNKRVFEEFAQKWMPKFSFLLPPKRRPIRAKVVAQSMHDLCFSDHCEPYLECEIYKNQ